MLKALTSPRGSNVLSVHYCSITTARPWRMHRFEFILFCEHRSQAMISQVVVLTKRQIDTIWASGDSLWYPVLDEVGHDDEVDGPVARVEQEEHEGEDVGGGAIEAQLEPSQLCLKIYRIQSKTIFGDQVILKHIWFISVLQLKVDVRVCPLSNRVIMAKETFAKLWGSVLQRKHPRPTHWRSRLFSLRPPGHRPRL